MIIIQYPIPSRGLGTDFAASERPITYAQALDNRFININGAAERRLGVINLVSGNGATVPGAPNLNRLHIYVAASGGETVMTSDTSGRIYRYNASTSAFVTALTGLSNNILLSVQVEDKLIFCNGVDRNFFTADAGLTFNELPALINQGNTGGSTNSTTLFDNLVSAWTQQTQIAQTDIIFNANCSAYGLVTKVSGAELTLTPIGSAATGSGSAAIQQTAGQVYRVLDVVASNIIPVGTTFDNVAILTSGSSTVQVSVSGVDFSKTIAATGDFVFNTTRNAVTQITGVSANLSVKRVSAQIAGDSVVFLKNAMPFTSYPWVNWGRTYYLDAKEPTKVRISAPDDAQDLATFAKTLNSATYSFGAIQPQGDNLLTMNTFQKYFVAAGSKYIYVFQGIDPISNTTAQTVDFTPVAVYPNGLVGRFAMASNGNNILFGSPDGVLNLGLGYNDLNLTQANLSDVIKSVVRQAIIAQTAINPDQMQLFFYPRRNWAMFLVGNTIYNFNNTPVTDDTGALQAGGSWSTFSGLFAQFNHYYVRRNGDLIACGNHGLVCRLDAGFTDLGDPIPTKLITPWYRVEEPQKTVRVKDGKYIKPIFESGGGVVYQIQAQAGFDVLSSDTATVTAVGGSNIGQFTVGNSPIGGSGVDQTKLSLRWRGEQVQLTIETESSAGPDVLTGYYIYGNQYGRR